MAKYTPRTAPDPNETGWPKGVKYIIWNEGCERFSYYGMRAILWVYIAGLYINLRGESPGVAEAAATQTYHTFTAGVYALPMIGALIADRLLGKYRTIMWLSVVYCFGHVALAVFEDPAWQMELFGEVFIDPIHGLYLGLMLIALGSGGIKPCVSANVGDQFGKGNWSMLEKVYNAFYFIINFGSFFATLFIPLIRGDKIIDPITGLVSYEGSVSLAFGIPGILMGLATIAFWMGRKEFVHVPPTQPGKLGLLDVVSGSALFLGTLGIPMFFTFMAEVWDVTYLDFADQPLLAAWFHSDGLFHTFHRTDWSVLLIAMGAFLGLFLALFAWRQRLKVDDGFLGVMTFGLFPKVFDRDHEAAKVKGLWPRAAARFGDEASDGARAVLRIMSIFALVSVFWALFDQHGSTWIQQAEMMDMVLSLDLAGWLISGAALGLLVGLAVGLSIGSTPARLWAGIGIGVVAGLVAGLLMLEFTPTLKLKPSQIPSLNPVMVMVLIPLTTFGLYPLFGKLGFKMTALRKMSLGMLMASLAFASVAVIQAAVDTAAEQGEQIHVMWQLIPYFIITLAEVMVSITGLEFGYSQAPKRMKSVIMGFWLLCVALGNKLVAFLAGFEDMPLEDFFWVFAALMFVAGGLFALRAAFYEYRDYTQ